MKKKLVFIDYSFHKDRFSFDFVKEILTNEYQIVEVWDESWNGSPSFNVEEVNKLKPDAIIFAQVYPHRDQLDSLKCKNVTWFPMFDTEVNKKEARYLKLIGTGLKIVAFCSRLNEKFLKLGFDSSYLQFFPRSEKRINKNNKGLSVFFYPRTDKITWKMVKTVLGKNFKGSLTIQNNTDPLCEFIYPSKSDIEKYNVNVVEIKNKDKRKERLELIELRLKHDVMFAPREYEGIGLTYLEVMAGGVAVISPDNPTMNEYIKDGENGYLYSMSNPQEIDFSNIESVKEAAHKSIEKGYEEWDKKRHNILKIVQKKSVTHHSLLGYLKAFVLNGIVKLKKVIM